MTQDEPHSPDDEREDEPWSLDDDEGEPAPLDVAEDTPRDAEPHSLDEEEGEPYALDDAAADPADLVDAVAGPASPHPAVTEDADEAEPYSLDDDAGPDYGPLDRGRDDLSKEKERIRILEEVLRDQVRREVLRDIAYRRPSASLRTRVVTLVLVLIAVGLWVFRVPGLQPEIAFPMPPTDEEAGLRLAAFVQAQQVEAFYQVNGRLPDVLRETGEPLPGIEYQRVDAHTYRLRAATERTSIEWVSTDSLPALLGDAASARLRTIVQ